jgi:hypothetical protein
MPSKTLPSSSQVDSLSTVTPAISIPTLVPQVLLPTTDPEQEGCKTIHNITICIQEIKRTNIDTRVKLKILVESNMVSGSGNSFIFPDTERGLYPVLLDEQGHSYSLKENVDNYWAQFDDAERVYFQTLSFETLPADTKQITVSMPIVAVDSPSKAEGFQLDLGANPQPGQTKPLDITITIDGQTFHFVKVEFEGDGVNSLLVILYTDPLKLSEEIFSVTPIFGDNGKHVFFGAKQGINGLPLQISTDLIVPLGKSSGSSNSTFISGVLNLKPEQIAYWYRGPFEITFQLP